MWQHFISLNNEAVLFFSSVIRWAKCLRRITYNKQAFAKRAQYLSSLLPTSTQLWECVCVCVWHEHKLNTHIFSVATVSSFLLPLIVQILGCRTNSLGWFSMSSIGLYFVSPSIAPWSMVWPKRVHTLIHLSTWMSLTRKLGGPCEIQSETANVR